MQRKVICEGTNVVMFDYDKYYKMPTYETFFNTKQGIEVIRGINGNRDPFVLDFPTLIDIGIMGHCPNHCEFCYQGSKYEPHMTLENFKRIIDEIKNYTNQIALGGRGDPNLHPNFREIIEYARESNVIPNYTTSGRGLTKDHIESSKSCGAVAVSNYGYPETFDAINGFLEAGIKTNIHFLLSSKSYYMALELLYGKNPWHFEIDLKKVNAIVFLLFKPQGRGKDLDWKLTELQLKIIAREIIKGKTQTKIGMDSCLVNKISKIIDLPDFMKMSVDTCEASRMSMYISPTMKAMPCSFADPEDGVSLEKDTIWNVWNKSDIFHEYRVSLFENNCSCPIFDGGIQNACI